MLGMAWAVISALGFGLYQVTNRRAWAGQSPYKATFFTLLVSAIVLGITTLLLQDWSLLLTAPPLSLVYFSLAGFFHFFVGWTLLNLSQARIGAGRTGALVGTSPIFATVTSALLLGEFVHPVALVGILFVVVGVYMVSHG